jgi:hypothetical protein
VPHYIILKGAETSRKDRQEANGFLRVWKEGEVLNDVCGVFRHLEKQLQKPEVIISYTVAQRDSAIEKLNLMLQRPYPGGEEEKLKHAQTASESDTEQENEDEETNNGGATTSRREAFRKQSMLPRSLARRRRYGKK